MDEITKLSQAIRIGSKLSEQCFSSYRDRQGRTCALGAAALALDPKFTERGPETAEMIITSRGIPLYDEINHPCNETTNQCKHIIVNLNDELRWSRERIADWLESVGR